MNRNQLLKEVNALAKELNVNIENMCKLKKDELQVEYNRLMELKNAPTVAEVVVEVAQPIEVVNVEVAPTAEPPIEVISEVAQSAPELKSEPSKDISIAKDSDMFPAVQVNNLANKLLDDFDHHTSTDDANANLLDLIYGVIDYYNKKVHHKKTVEDKVERLNRYFDNHVYGNKDNIEFVHDHIFPDMPDDIVDEFYYCLREEFINAFINIEPATEDDHIEVDAKEVAPVYNMPTAKDIEDVFQEVDNTTATQNKPAYDYGIRYFDNYEVERDDDRDFGRWGDDDEPCYKRVRDMDDDRDFGRFQYYDKNYDKYDYNNNDTIADDEDLMMDNDDDTGDDAAINNDDEVAQEPEEEEVDEVIAVENTNNTVQLTLSDLPAPTVNINPIQSQIDELHNKNRGFNRLCFNDKCKDTASPYNMPLMSALSMDENKRPYRHAILRDEQSNKFYLFESYDKVRNDDRFKKEIKHFHEIMVPDCYRRVFFDIDREEPFTTQEIIQIQQILTDAVAEIYNVKLDSDEFAVYTSQKLKDKVTEDMNRHTEFYINIQKFCNNDEKPKGSIHLIARHLMVFDHIEHKALYEKVAQYLQPMRAVYPWIKYWDSGTCKSTQNLRCPGSYKYKSLRKKICLSHQGLELFIGEVTAENRVAPRLVSDQVREVNNNNNKKKKQVNTADIIDENGLSIQAILQMPELKEILGDDYVYASHDVEFIKFKRVKKVKCMFCNVVHDQDQWLYARMSTKGIYVSCLRAGSHCNKALKKQFKIIRTYTKQERVRLSDIYTGKLFNDIKQDKSDNARLFDINLTRKVFHDRYINDFEDCRALYVKADMGMGKTQKIFDFINRYNPKILIFLSFRITFTLDIIKECGKKGIKIDNYMDLDGFIHVGPGNDEHKYIAIQYDSLKRLVIKGNAEDIMVVMDESESIIQQMNSLTNTSALTNYEVFDMLIARSSRLICMDANLGERTHMLIKNTLPPDTKINLHEYTYKKLADHTVHITCNEGRFIQKIIDDVKQGKRVFIPTNSRKYADKLYLELLKHIDKSKIMKYAGNDGSDSDHIEGKTKEYEKHEHLRNDINTFITNFDVVISTPTFTAGVSITVKHFDRIYGYFMDRSADVLQCTQLLGRVRDIGDKEIYLCFKPARSTLPTTESDIFDLIDNKRFAYIYNFNDLGNIDDVDKLYNRDIHKYVVDRASLRNRVTVYNLIERYKSRNYFGFYMLQVLRRAGVSIKKMFSKQDESNHADMKDKLKAINKEGFEHKIQECEEILKAVVTKEILDKVKSGENDNRAKEKETINAYKKAYIMAKYDLNDDDMNKIQYGTILTSNKTMGGDIMHELMQKTTQDVYKNLQSYYYDEDHGDNRRANDIKNLQGLIQDNNCNTGAKVNICKYILKALSFDGLDDDKKVTMEELNTNIQSLLKTLKDKPKINKAISAFRAKKTLINVNEQSFKNNMLMINGFLQSTFGVIIKKTGRNTDDYHVSPGVFIYNAETKKLRFHVLNDLQIPVPAN